MSLIFLGLAFTTALTTLVMEINNVGEAGLAILYMYDTFSGIPWKDCKFKGAEESCIPFNPPEMPKNNCEIASDQYNKYLLHTTKQYATDITIFRFRYNKRNIFHKLTKDLHWQDIGSIKIDWAIATWFCCIVVCVFAVMGFKKFSSFLYKTVLIMVLAFALPLNVISDIYSIFNGENYFSIYKSPEYLLEAKVSRM